MTQLTITGHSDDLIEIEGDIREEFTYREPHDASEAPLLAFSDGTVLRIFFNDAGVWRITPVTRGDADLEIVQAPEDDDDNRTDKATLSDYRGGTLKWVVLGSAYAKK